AALLPPYAVGQRKQPAVSARLGGRGGEHVAKIVLVLLPYSSAVRKLPELDLQHRVLSGAARRGVGGQQASIAHQDVPHIAKKKRAGGPFPARALPSSRNSRSSHIFDQRCSPRAAARAHE